MKPLLIEPRDPLIARDGRPFKATPGARARTLEFPLPTTVAGAIRTRSGSDADGVFKTDIGTVLTWEIRGPLLVNVKTLEFYIPAPLDALMLDKKHLHFLHPITLPASTLTDFDSPAIVGLTSIEKGKPKGMPRYWYWEKFKTWLEHPKTHEAATKTVGMDGPTLEYRTNVGMDSDSQTAQDGALFGTSGLEFLWIKPNEPADSKNTETKPRDDQKLSRVQDLAIYLETNAPEKSQALWSIGGERRLSRWSQPATSQFPEMSETLKDRIAKSQACRVILLTPAYFNAGWKPTFLLKKTHTLQHDLELIAAAVGRPQVVSGWDYAPRKADGGLKQDSNGRIIHGEPKATRRLAPAGSVYFVKFHKDESETNIKSWLTQTWFQNISDEDLSRRDGLGLVALGYWCGKTITLGSKEGECECHDKQ